MHDFIKKQYEKHKITAEKVWSYCPKYITAEEAEEIAGPRPEA